MNQNWETNTIDSFSELESAILEWFKHTYANDQLNAQIDTAKFLKRVWTRVGFYVYLEVPKELDTINLNDFGKKWPINGPEITSNDIQYGGGTILWGKDGHITCIEMYSYGKYFNKVVNKFELSSWIEPKVIYPIYTKIIGQQTWLLT